MMFRNDAMFLTFMFDFTIAIVLNLLDTLYMHLIFNLAFKGFRKFLLLRQLRSETVN